MQITHPQKTRGAFLSLAAVLMVAAAPSASAQVFTDTFTGGASSLWQNEHGGWFAAGGAYDSTFPANYPNACSSLPFDLSDTVIECDVLGANDGGIWVRSADAPGTSVGRKGILLVTAPPSVASGVYWHVVPTGDGYGSIIGAAPGLFVPGSNVHVRIEATGNTYKAYINGSATPATTLIDGTFSHGNVALYDFSGQKFDNVVLNGTLVCSIPADLNCDGIVDGTDLGLLLGAWGASSGEADLNSDGSVDGSDLGLLLGSWT